MTKIAAKIVAHSITEHGEELVSVLATMPRIVLSETNTHRMLSKNTSSSRAIPFTKLVEVVQNDPFTPIAWQKNHPGMQGSVYLSKTEEFSIDEFMEAMHFTLSQILDKKSPEYIKLQKEFDNKMKVLENILTSDYLPKELIDEKKTLDNWWLFARDRAVEAASIMYILDVTKQLDNRLLEPFMWTTMLITGNRSDGGWENFFNLRNPVYEFEGLKYKSRKDLEDATGKADITELDWLLMNKGQAEIHMMALAEEIYDAVNASTPKLLKPGEYHIPFLDELDFMGLGEASAQYYMDNPTEIVNPDKWAIKASVALAAWASYTVVGVDKKHNYAKMFELHDNLIIQDPQHASPMEHIGKCMTDEERYSSIKTSNYPIHPTSEDGIVTRELYPQQPEYSKSLDHSMFGWCRNFKGFIPYRHIIETGQNI